MFLYFVYYCNPVYSLALNVNQARLLIHLSSDETHGSDFQKICEERILRLGTAQFIALRNGTRQTDRIINGAFRLLRLGSVLYL